MIKRPWPSIARTVYNNHTRYLNTYMKTYKDRYFTGDGASRDKDGFIWIEVFLHSRAEAEQWGRAACRVPVAWSLG